MSVVSALLIARSVLALIAGAAAAALVVVPLSHAKVFTQTNPNPPPVGSNSALTTSALALLRVVRPPLLCAGALPLALRDAVAAAIYYSLWLLVPAGTLHVATDLALALVVALFALLVSHPCDVLATRAHMHPALHDEWHQKRLPERRENELAARMHERTPSVLDGFVARVLQSLVRQFLAFFMFLICIGWLVPSSEGAESRHVINTYLALVLRWSLFFPL